MRENPESGILLPVLRAGSSIMGRWIQLTVDGGEVEHGNSPGVEPQRPSIGAALRAVAGDADPGDKDIKGIEIKITAGGQVAYRLTPSDGSETLGGVLTIDE